MTASTDASCCFMATKKRLSVCLSVCLSGSLSVCMSVRMCVCVCLSAVVGGQATAIFCIDNHQIQWDKKKKALKINGLIL